MKKFAYALFATVATSASAVEPDYAVTFEIEGGIAQQEYTRLDLEVVKGGRYMAAYGSLDGEDPSLALGTGSCVWTSLDGVYCNLHIGHLSLRLSLNADLRGVLSVVGSDGEVLESASVSRAAP